MANEVDAVTMALSAFSTAFLIFYWTSYLFGWKNDPIRFLYSRIFIFAIMGYFIYSNPYDIIIFSGCSVLGAHCGDYLSLKMQLLKEKRDGAGPDSKDGG